MKRAESQRKRILKHLLSGKALTPIQALNLFGCLRLSARIKDLRDDGHNIQTEIINSGNKQFANYKLINNGNNS